MIVYQNNITINSRFRFNSGNIYPVKAATSLKKYAKREKDHDHGAHTGLPKISKSIILTENYNVPLH